MQTTSKGSQKILIYRVQNNRMQTNILFYSLPLLHQSEAWIDEEMYRRLLHASRILTQL